jgi:hypothetical protein
LAIVPAQNAASLTSAQRRTVIVDLLQSWKASIQARNRWIAPVLLTAFLSLTLLTATFNDALGVPKEAWAAIFVMCLVGAAIWSLGEIIALLKNASGKSAVSIDGLISQLGKTAADFDQPAKVQPEAPTRAQ